MQKNVPLVKQNVMKFEEDRELIRRERRDGEEGEERGLRKGAERDREKRDKRVQFEEEDKEHTCLCLLFSFLKALSSLLDSAVKRCSIEL